MYCIPASCACRRCIAPGLHSSDLVRVRVSPQTLGKYTLAVDNVYILLQSDDVLEVTVS